MRILLTGISTRGLAQSARAGGYEPVTLDYFGDYDQRALVENYALRRDFGLPYGPAHLYAASRRLRYEAVAYTASLENHPDVLAQLAPAPVRVLGNSARTLARVRHWPSFFDFLAGHGRPGPATYAGGRLPPAVARGGRWLRKPARSGGGHDVRFWPADRPPGAGYLLQGFVDGPVCSAAFLADGAQAVLLGLSEQLIGRTEFGAGGFAYCGNIFPWLGGSGGEAERTDATAQAAELCGALAREYGLVGLNGLDFVWHDGRVCPLEVNPRYAASMELMEWAAGVSLFDWHVRAVLEGWLPSLNPAGIASQSYYGKAILYAERDCAAPDTRAWPERLVRDVPFPGDRLGAGEPVCTVLAQGVTPAACYAALLQRAGELKGELYA